MLLVIDIIAIVILAVGMIMIGLHHDAGYTIGSCGLSILMISGIFSMIIGIAVVNGGTIDEKIAMYQEENAVIEGQISELVSQYMEYEQDTYSSLQAESSVVLVSLYPELKSDELVKKQCDIYVSNNEKIKELKEDKINMRVKKWWLYFGK